jgi:hypothetical protein
MPAKAGHPIFSRKGWIVRPLSRTMTPNVCRRCADAWTGRVFGLSKRPGIKVLPVKLQHTRAPVGIITLKNRTLSPSHSFSSTRPAKSRSLWDEENGRCDVGLWPFTLPIDVRC